MINYDLYLRWYYYLIQNWGIKPNLAQIVAYCQTIMQQNGIEAVTITSGYRSPKRQRELLNRWISGNRTGLVARPSRRSWHMQGYAIDVSTRINPRSFLVFRNLMLTFRGIRWGGNFNSYDPVHFDLPTGELKSIDQLA